MKLDELYAYQHGDDYFKDEKKKVECDHPEGILLMVHYVCSECGVEVEKINGKWIEV